MHSRFLGFRDPVSAWLHLAIGVSNIGLWAGALYVSQRHVLLAPLHYTIYFGIDLSGPGQRLLTIPAFGLVVWLMHSIIGRYPMGVIWERGWLIVALAMQIILAGVLAVLWYIGIQP